VILTNAWKLKKTKIKLIQNIKTAKEEKIIMCLSHESFEVWLLAHLGEVSSEMASRKKAGKEAIKKGLLSGSNGKQVVEKMITPQTITTALKESARLRKVYGANILNSAPTTDVDLIIEKLSL